MLLSSQHFNNPTSENTSERVLQPMRWGLIPSWHRGDPKEFSYNMSNARSDTLLDKRSFKLPLEKGKRCVVLAEGYSDIFLDYNLKILCGLLCRLHWCTLKVTWGLFDISCWMGCTTGLPPHQHFEYPFLFISLIIYTLLKRGTLGVMYLPLEHNNPASGFEPELLSIRPPCHPPREAGGGRDSHIKRMGVLSGNYETNP